MNPSYGSRVGLVGATSLQGRELTTVMKERNFPVLSSVAIEPDKKEPEIPVLDVESGALESTALQDLKGDELDFIFVAAPLTSADWDVLASGARGDASGRVETKGPVVISLVEILPEADSAIFSSHGPDQRTTPSTETKNRFIRSPHAVSVVLSTLLLRIAAQFPVVRSVANVFAPASNLGPQAVEELQEQILKLMSFKKIPEAVFGSQIAFNMLPRLAGRTARTAIPELEARIRRELSLSLAGRIPNPAVRVLQVPVFFCTAFSVYVEVGSKADAALASKALEGDGVQVHRLSQPAATQVEAAGSADILVDGVVEDASGNSGLWLWAAVDDLHLAAKSAVEMAEQFLKKAMLH
ncbi:MAG TPA: Asd/ArgC dimerization domain-containing protein [Terriglobia bacterium]|nr:Asd/ArgC dimerization domain-containing protein [Terriglobia bacterium]